MSKGNSVFVKVEDCPQHEEPQTSEEIDQRLCEFKWVSEKSFGDFLSQGEFNDVAFKTKDDNIVFANRITLAHSSEVFLDLFRQQHTNDSVEPIELDLEQGSLMNILTLVYFNKVQIPENKRTEFEDDLTRFGIKASIEENRNKNRSQFANWTPDEMMDKFGKPGDKGFLCMVPGCLANIGTKNDLKIHFRDRHIELGATYLCPKCSAPTSSQNGFRRHLKRSHPELRNVNYRELLPEPIFQDPEEVPMKRTKKQSFPYESGCRM